MPTPFMALLFALPVLLTEASLLPVAAGAVAEGDVLEAIPGFAELPLDSLQVDETV